MPFTARVSGTYRPLLWSYRTGGNWRDLLWFTRVSAVWRSINQLTASVDFTTASGSALVPGPATTGNVTASGSGGTGSYTYAWEFVSGDTNIQCINASGAVAHWLRTSGTTGTFIATWRCKVSDGVSTAYAPDVTVTITLS